MKVQQSLPIAIFFLLTLGVTAAGQDERELPRIMGVTAVVGGPVTIKVMPRNSPDREIWMTSSPRVVEALLPAVASHATVEVEFFVGSKTVKRVLPYSLPRVADHHLPGEYCLSRIATQRGPEGSEHLEVFLRKRQGDEETFNIFDPILRAVFLHLAERHCNYGPGEAMEFVIGIENEKTVVSVGLGEQ